MKKLLKIRDNIRMRCDGFRLGTIFLETLLQPPIDERKEPWREIPVERYHGRKNQ